MQKPLDKQLLLDMHKPGWGGFWLSQIYAVCYLALLIVIGWALAAEQYAAART